MVRRRGQGGVEKRGVREQSSHKTVTVLTFAGLHLVCSECVYKMWKSLVWSLFSPDTNCRDLQETRANLVTG